ncbi:nitroreductase family protein [Clostridium sp. DL1XJH146]
MSIVKGIQLRKSVRKYKKQCLLDEDKNKVLDFISNSEKLFPEIEMEAILVDDSDDLRKILKGFFKIKAPHYMFFISKEQDGWRENVGYYGEQIVLKLAKEGIGTCWVGSNVDEEKLRKVIKISSNQKFCIMIALGYPEEELKPISKRKRISIEEIIEGNPNEQEVFILEALRDAPSSINSQPWKVVKVKNRWDFYRQPNNVLLKKFMKKMNSVDMGIGLCHVVMASREMGYSIEMLKVNELLKNGESYFRSIEFN